MCEQLTLFNQTGLRYRCHLYCDGQLEYTAIPSQAGITLVGMPKPMLGTKNIKRLTQSAYEAYRDMHELEEVSE